MVTKVERIVKMTYGQNPKCLYNVSFCSEVP